MPIFKKGNKLYSIFYQKCPRCHEGDLFTYKNAYRIKGFFDMPKSCPNCNQVYSLEPSFFYGAMYVNYAFTVAICVALFIATYVIGEMLLGLDVKLAAYIAIIAVGLLLVSPVTFRLGRSVWINLFVKYDPHAGKGKDQERSQ